MKSILVCLALFSSAALAFAAHHTDLEYGHAGGESLKLDAYVPDGPGPHAVVILVHGGGWTGGDKNGGKDGKSYIQPMHAPLERAGYAWFSINYRLAPKHRYPANLEDVQMAIRWVRNNTARFDLDPKKIVLCGESAGGHLASMAAVRAGANSGLAAVVAFYTRFELTGVQLPDGAELPPKIAALIGGDKVDGPTRVLLRDASPLHHVKAGLPPFLLLHGTADASVPFEQSPTMQAKLRGAGVRADLITVEGGIHGMDGWDEAGQTNYKAQIVAWLNRTLGRETKTAQR
jgi:acetyl esterase/lipase